MEYVCYYLLQKSILEDSPTNVLGDRVIQVTPRSAIVVDIQFVKERVSSIVLPIPALRQQSHILLLKIF
jgi:hypothetical protein